MRHFMTHLSRCPIHFHVPFFNIRRTEILLYRYFFSSHVQYRSKAIRMFLISFLWMRQHVEKLP